MTAESLSGVDAGALAAGQLGGDAIHASTFWTCEKWSEEACDYVRRRRGLDGFTPVGSELLRDVVGAAEDIVVVPGNLLLNEGIQRLIDKLIGVAGNDFGNTNAYIGVGTSSTGELATQTELQGTQDSSNRFYKAMVATYPQRPGSNGAQSCDWRSDFTSTEANFVWAEWTVSSGATTASGGGFLVGTTNLNRKVQALGTKSTGTWTMTATITFA